MDMEFLVHDTFSLVRPQWQIATSLDEASQKFAEAVSRNYQAQEAEKANELDEAAESSTDDELDEDDNRLPELEEFQTSSDDNEVFLSGLSVLRCSWLMGDVQGLGPC